MKWISLISNTFTIVASGIAIFVFLTKRKSIASVFDLLINYTYQLSLSEIKEKLEKLNEYNAKDSEDNEKIINILNEIIGQIKGNETLKAHFSELLKEIDSFALGRKKLTEPKKRAVVSELRERLRHLNVRNIDKLVGENK
tara:strand:+ start:96 stop:518 length:423 start_codon:yes stop_codon:yes gene_type:complete